MFIALLLKLERTIKLCLLHYYQFTIVVFIVDGDNEMTTNNVIIFVIRGGKKATLFLRNSRKVRREKPILTKSKLK